MKTFKPGDYVRLENEKIPAMIELLRVNGWKIWDSQITLFDTNDNHILFSNENDFVSCFFDSNIDIDEDDRKTELSIHDFLVTALRLKEGDGMRGDKSERYQFEHIYKTLVDHGIDTLQTSFSISLGFGIHYSGVGCVFGINHIDYTEWCKRLNVEPIPECVPDHVKKVQEVLKSMDEIGGIPSNESFYAEFDFRCRSALGINESKQIITLPDGSTVDLTKPIEVSDDGTDWEEKEGLNLIEVTLKGHAILEFDDVFYAYKFIRNKPEPKLHQGEKVWFRSSDSEPWYFGTIEETKDGSIAVNHQNYEPVSNVTIRPAFVDGKHVYPPFES